MASTSDDIICGACSKLIKDPYRLPCGHTFCLRPCLLAHAKAETARCIKCCVDFNASRLSPDYSVAAKLHLRLQENSENANSGSETSRSKDLREDGDRTPCSTCRKATDTGQLKYCQHCNRIICPICTEKHFDSYSVSLRIQLTSLQRKETDIFKELQNLKAKLGAAGSASTYTSNANIYSELDAAISQLTVAVNQSVDKALMKVETLDTDGSAGLSDKAKKLFDNSCDLKEIQEFYQKSEDSKIKLAEAVEMFKRLKEIEQKATDLSDSFNSLPTASIMQLKLSNCVQQEYQPVEKWFGKFKRGEMRTEDEELSGHPKEAATVENIKTFHKTILHSRKVKLIGIAETLKISKNIQQLRELDLIVGDGLLPLSSLLSNCTGRVISRERRDSPTAGTSKVKLFVGGLRKTHTEEQLKRHFESNYGPLVDCYVARDFKTRESRCYGFVTFKESHHASRALAEFPHFIEGAPIQVRPYKFEKNERNQTTFGGASSEKAPNKPPNHKVMVIGISETTTRDAIKTALSRFGQVERVYAEPKRGFSVVNFEKPYAVDLAVRHGQININDCNCEIYPHNVGKQLIRDKEGRKDCSAQEVDGLRLFVGNLSPSANKDVLKEYFSKFGSVTKVDVIFDSGTSKPRGLAFVNMSTRQEVETILNQRPHLLKNKPIIVRQAYKKDLAKAAPSLENDELTADSQMVMHDIPANTSRQDLLQCFSKFGGITALRIDNKKRVGFLTFESVEALKEAVKSSEHEVRGKDLRVSLAKDNIVNTPSASKLTLNIYVGDISPITTEFDLILYFEKFGFVVKAKVVKKGAQLYGLVRMASSEAVRKAVQSKAPKISGHYVTIRPFYSQFDASSHKSRVRHMRREADKTTITAANKPTASAFVNVQDKPKVEPKAYPFLDESPEKSSPSHILLDRTDYSSSPVERPLRRAKIYDDDYYDYYGDDFNSKDADLGDGFWDDSD